MVALVLLALVVVFSVQGCSGEGNSSKNDSNSSANSDTKGNTSGESKDSSKAKKDAESSTGGTAKDDKSGDKKKAGSKDKDQPPEQPYAAIAPPKDAKPLDQRFDGSGGDVLAMENQMSGGAAENQYAGETTGETTGAEKSQRSVPLGETLLSGKKDTSDGPLKKNRLVAYYGHPFVAQMGILGELDPNALMKQLKEQTAAYSKIDPERPAVPTIELIASVAQPEPGPDGLYVTQTPKKEIEKYIDLAKKNDALVLLDVQLGRATVMQEVKILEEYLKEPNVHLAIDTEYSIEEGQIPGQDLGTVDSPEIQEAVKYLDELVKKENIPDKVLMVHQFESGIVTNKQTIQPTSNVEVVLHADGFGGPGDKLVKYAFLARDEPIQYGGFKVFYKQDTPVLTPKEVLQMDPVPAVVTYQ